MFIVDSTSAKNFVVEVCNTLADGVAALLLSRTINESNEIASEFEHVWPPSPSVYSPQTIAPMAHSMAPVARSMAPMAHSMAPMAHGPCCP